MVKITTGYLFKKRIVSYQNQKHEVFEFIDYTIGIRFTNTQHNEVCNIAAGDYIGTYASNLDELKNDGDYIFMSDDINQGIQEINNSVNYQKLREYRIGKTAKYYIRNNKGTGLSQLLNNEIYDFLEQGTKSKKRDFNEEEFETATDISEMYMKIKETIISQDEQIMKILTALFKNQAVISSTLNPDLITKLKESILICGPTGTGKTEILKRIAKLYNVPLVIQDATSLSEVGYMGRNITDMLEDLYLAADKDIELAQKGILVIDEFDKLAEKKEDHQTHVSRMGVQRSLLKLLDGTTYYLKNTQFDTSKLTIVALGAFTGINENNNAYHELSTEDFVNYGIISELIGRFSKTITMNQLTKKDFINIFKFSNFSPLNTYKELFDMLNVGFEYTEDFIEYIADIAISKQSGARSLKIVFDECISSALFRIFAGEYSKISLIKPENPEDPPYILTKKSRDSEKPKILELFKKNKENE